MYGSIASRSNEPTADDFDELRASHGEKRNAGFGSHRFRQQRFADAWRTKQESAFGNLTAQFLKTTGMTSPCR